MLQSTLYLVVSTLILVFVVTYLLSLMVSKKSVLCLIAASMVFSSVTIWYVDVELPLTETHFRDVGVNLPIHFAALAWVAQNSFILCVILGGQKIRGRIQK
jgi:hypothetical protein